jgi:hypothetical protein
VNGQPITGQSNSTNASSISLDSISSSTTMDKDTDMPSLSAADSISEKKKKTSPVVGMAEASFLSQQAALKEASNFEALIAIQQEELSLHKDEKKPGYEE